MRLASLLAVLLAFAALPAAAQPRCEAPRVLFTVDKSSSMLDTLGDGTTKWEAARTALAEVASEIESGVEMGLQVFPFPDRCEPGEVTIEVGENTATELMRGLGEPPPTGGNYTPMAQTLGVLTTYAPILAPESDAHVILITDGWQWCSPYDPATRFTPVAEVEMLRSLGVTVHVVGFGAGVDSLTLNRAAVAAGTALPGCDPSLSEPGAANHCYQQADDLAELRTALLAIARDITEEMCDGFDNDCDGMIDEGFDVDADGYTVCGSTDGGTVVEGGSDPIYVDCNDTDAAVFPGAEDICDGLDNDCDGSADPGCSCLDGEERECGSTIGACSLGAQVCVSGAWSVCEGATGPALTDLCDGMDEDCDGVVDEDAGCGEGSLCVAGICEPLAPEEPEEPTPAPEPEPE
ncbi:MAG TPA: MopE-related protein, partial [Polyangiaceae bacterium LLY-WYZ-15_(1-7)]|nr:MopE-related protein [Polyangiaceae bacterium LLY-WYZ-15_(1-7)]